MATLDGPARNKNLNLTRDKDLLSTDHYLTDDALDDLWKWFCAANTDGIDLQLVFVKMVNSARKPYVNYINSKHNEPTSISPKAASFISPSQSTVIKNEGASSYCQQDDAGTDTLRIITDLQIEHGLFKDQIKSLTETVESISLPPIPPPAVLPSSSLRVAIRSAHFTSHFINMNGLGITKGSSGGGGSVAPRTFIEREGTFELVPHPELGPGIVSFKATCFDNVFLRADVQETERDKKKPSPVGGVVNCEYGCTPWTKFRLVSIGLGVLAIELVAFPGLYLRLDGGEKAEIGLQGAVEGHEKFHVLVIP